MLGFDRPEESQKLLVVGIFQGIQRPKRPVTFGVDRAGQGARQSQIILSELLKETITFLHTLI